MKINVEELSAYQNYGKALKLSTEKAEVVVTLGRIFWRIKQTCLKSCPTAAYGN